jgi:chaperonin GroES
MKIKAVNERVVLSPVEESSTSKGGIYIPDSAKERPNKGKVVSSSSKSFKENDIVLYNKYGVNEIELDGRKLIVLKSEDILALLEE